VRGNPVFLATFTVVIKRKHLILIIRCSYNTDYEVMFREGIGQTCNSLNTVQRQTKYFTVSSIRIRSSPFILSNSIPPYMAFSFRTLFFFKRLLSLLVSLLELLEPFFPVSLQPGRVNEAILVCQFAGLLVA
jgi:hypothetical protein